MQIIEEQRRAAVGVLIGVIGAVVAGVIGMPVGPPALLGLHEQAAQVGIALPRQHAREPLPVGLPAVPAVVDRRLKDFDQLGHKEARG